MAYNPSNPNGQATMANSAPVVIASNQTAVPITDNSGSITVDGSVTVSGTVTANAGTGTQNVSVQNASIPVTDNGGSLTVDGSVSVSNFPATQPVSGTVTVTQATASNLNANVTVQNASIPVTDNGGSLTVDGTVTANAGTGTFAVSGTVTANAGTGTMNVSVQNASIPVTDNGGSLTVDGTVAATQSGTWSSRTQDGSGNAVTSRTTGSARPFDVAIVDGSGNQVTSFGGGTQYADGASVATPTGTAALGFDGTNVQVLSTNATGHLNIADGGNTITVDGTVNAAQSGTWNVGLNAGSNAIGSITNTSFAVTQATASNLNANVTVQNASIPVTDNAGSLTVDNNGTFAVQATQSGTWTFGANSGVDIGDVTINNADGSPVPTKLGDGTNYLSVDTAHNDGESNTENHFDTAAKAMHYNGTTWDRMRGDTTGTNQQGNIAHDGIDAGNPVKIGAKAIAHGTNPTAVAASDRTDLYANRAGILWTIGGHPNIITRSVVVTDANGAQTDASIVGTIAAGTKVAVTSMAVTVDSATTATGGVSVKIGFGATTIPADSLTGANGILLDHPGIAAGSGIVIGNGSGLLGIGADGEELRLTCEDPVGGNIAVTFSYYTIES